MKTKPLIYKRDDGWAVELPAFGFAITQTVKAGFPSREKAGEWLVLRGTAGSAGQACERTVTPEDHDLRYGKRWPLVIR